MRKLIVLFVFAFLFSSSTVFSAEKRFDIPLGNTPQLGPQDAPITIIEFLDFQ